MGWPIREWFSHPIRDEIELISDIAELQGRSAKASTEIVEALGGLMQVVNTLNDRIVAIENILRQQGLAK